jgi:hypothetical protein
VHLCFFFPQDPQMTLPQWRQWWRRCSTLKPLEHVEHTCRSGRGSNIRSQAARAALYKPCRGYTARRAHLGALVRLPLRPPVRLRRDGALANCSGLAGKHIARDRPETPKDTLPASHTVANIAGLDLWHPCSTQNSIFCVDNSDACAELVASAVTQYRLKIVRRL